MNNIPVKALAEVGAAVIAALSMAVFDTRPDSWTEWVNVIILALGAGYVYITTNDYTDTFWQYAKAFAAGISLLGVVLVSAYGGGSFSRPEVAQMAVAFMGVVGVVYAPRDAKQVDTASWGRHAKRDE